MHCQTDAAWDKSTKAGICWIFTSTESTPEYSGTKAIKSVSSPIMGEALAVKLALQSAASLGIKTLTISSDNQTLIRVLNNKLFDKEIYEIAHNISSFSSLSLLMYRSFSSIGLRTLKLMH
ncbi:hypothetical protein Bca4012_103493 [Brassica carinata]